jgi:hypothetical protein
MTDLWVTDDGSYGSGDFGTFDAEHWTKADWEELETAPDWQRLSVAHSIQAKYERLGDKFLAFLQWEESNATQYHAEELARDNRRAVAIPMTADYWRGYADAVANALAAYAGPTDITETMKGN